MNSLEELKQMAGISIYQYYIPGITLNKKSSSPLRNDDSDPSFSLYEKNSVVYFKDFGNGKGGDCIDFIREYEGISQVDAIKRFKDLVNDNGGKPESTTGQKKKSDKTITRNQIKETILKGGYKYQRAHLYDAGNPVYVKVIFKTDRGDKQGRFYHLIDKDLWLYGRGGKATLYNQKALQNRPDDLVLTPEGEPDTDTLTGLGYLSVTPGGTNSFKPSIDGFKEMLEALRDRDIVLFPDNDSPGDKEVKERAKYLKGTGKSIKQVNLKKAWFETFNEECPEKADITDFVNQYRSINGEDGLKDAIDQMIDDAMLIEVEEEKEGKPDFDPYTVLKRGSDLQSLDVSIEWIVNKLIPKESITLISGKGGIGKTWLNIQLADAISEGTSFMGIETIKTPVVYVDFENSLPVLVERLNKVGALDVLFWHPTNEIRPPRLDSDQWELYKALPQGSLVIFDTLRASQSRDENDSRHMAFIMMRLKELRDMGFTIILLHHTPKANDRIYKGSTAIFDLADHVLSLHKVRKGSYQEVSDDDDGDENSCYKFGTKDKTRYEPSHIFIEFDPKQGFIIAPDPDEEPLRDLYHLIVNLKNNAGEPPIQKTIIDAAKNELELSNRKTRALLNKGEGKCWDSCKIPEKNNARVYEPKSVFQFSHTIYSDQTDKPSEQFNHCDGKTKGVKEPESLDNTEFDGFSEGVCKSDKTPINNEKGLIGDDWELME